VARKVMVALEEYAREFGYPQLILETGNRQPEAIHLYETMGYERGDCYDDYSEETLSVCFEKNLLA
jgi:putative acetyltransferase